MKKLFHSALLICSLLVAIQEFATTASAQVADSTQTDSLCGGPVRPRRGTFLVEAYPSPALSGSNVVIQYYNLDPQVIALRVVDLLDRTVASGDLQQKALTPGGLHPFRFSTAGLASGMYFIRLSSYTDTGTLDQVQDTRFVIIH